MAEHILKIYTCDRCDVKIDRDDPASLTWPNIEAIFQDNNGSPPTLHVTWRDLCPDCFQCVYAFFNQKVSP